MPRPKYDDIPAQYESEAIERRWSEYWVKESLYRADPKKSGKPFSMVIPPPNVTGVLHMGHALNSTLQDILARHARMQGKNVVWIVGTDHAGIATQNVVEKQLAAEGKKRHELGRKAFVERVWQWRRDSGGQIIAQLKRLGASCDFSRERFTMDEGLSRAVREVFVSLYEEALIYRGERLINWCPRCETALSDLEVEYEEVKGHLWPIQYPVIGSTRRLTVATTRPETYLGDTAVAVHPEDERYRDLIGKEVELPFVGRRIPIVADAMVDPEFGSGAVKVTPAHDFTDFEIGNRHDLPRLAIFTPKALLNENAGAYAGLERFAARKKIIQDLINAGFMDEGAIQKHLHQVGHCYRCKTVLEPYLSMQWFVKTAPLAEAALTAVKTTRTRFVPENWEKTYFQWLENIRDWCISRQIWWGHQIPAWYCDKGHVTVSREDPTNCSACKSSQLLRDGDVLDTWFSSALWPFSTLGWPKGDSEGLLDRYYPTSVLVTGFDIIFFWVARMMMMGLHFMKEVPFTHVYIHALVRDASGQKMSKSKGNVMDPLYLMDKYGTDAVRFTLAALAAQGRDIKLDEARIEGYRHFINKIWNATRFLFRYLPEGDWKGDASESSAFAPNHWIRERLAQTIDTTERAYASYSFNDVAHGLYRFFWDDYCAWYIEWVKTILADETHPERRATLGTAIFVLEASLRLLHPLIPFITEEIWHWLGQSGKSISLAALPRKESIQYEVNKVQEAQDILGVIESIRRLRGENGVSPATKIHVDISGESVAQLMPYTVMIVQMARLQSIEYRDAGFKPHKSAMDVTDAGFHLAIPMQGLIDIDAELMRLKKERDKLEKELQKIKTKFDNPHYIERAPQELVAQDRTLIAELTEKLANNARITEQMEGYR